MCRFFFQVPQNVCHRWSSHSPTRNDHYFQATLVFFWRFWNVGRTKNTCENNYHKIITIHSARPTVSPVATIVFCCIVLKSVDGRTDQRTDNMWENNDDFLPWLWVGRVDQQQAETVSRLSRSIFDPTRCLVCLRAWALTWVTPCRSIQCFGKFSKFFISWQSDANLKGQKTIPCFLHSWNIFVVPMCLQ